MLPHNLVPATLGPGVFLSWQWTGRWGPWPCSQGQTPLQNLHMHVHRRPHESHMTWSHDSHMTWSHDSQMTLSHACYIIVSHVAFHIGLQSRCVVLYNLISSLFEGSENPFSPHSNTIIVTWLLQMKQLHVQSCIYIPNLFTHSYVYHSLSHTLSHAQYTTPTVNTPHLPSVHLTYHHKVQLPLMPAAVRECPDT